MFEPEATSRCVAPASRTALASPSESAPASPSAMPASRAARSGGRRRANAASADRRARWAQAQGRKRTGAPPVETATSRAWSTQPQPAAASAPASSKSPGSRGRRGSRSFPATTASRPFSRSPTSRPRGSQTCARWIPVGEANASRVRQPRRVRRTGASSVPATRTGPAYAASLQPSSRAGARCPARRAAKTAKAPATTAQNSGRRRIPILSYDRPARFVPSRAAVSGNGCGPPGRRLYCGRMLLPALGGQENVTPGR